MVDDFEVSGILDVLGALPPAPTGQDLADAVGAPLTAFWDVLVRALAMGAIERFDPTDGATLYLPSASACASMGIMLDDDGQGRWVWRKIGERPRPIRSRCHGIGDSIPVGDLSNEAGSMEFNPLVLAIEAEKADRKLAAFEADPQAARRVTGIATLPLPTVLLGSTSRWDGPPPAKGVCPTCGGRDLKPSECCLVCLRWGLDRLLAKGSRRNQPKDPAKFKAKGAKAKDLSTNGRHSATASRAG